MRLFEIKIVVRNITRVCKALLSHRHPFLAQIVAVRRCNLTCSYCTEADKTSRPVPLPQLKLWIDKLAELGTAHVTISGGEPMLHPELNEIISHIRKRKMIAGLLTNGSLIDLQRIRCLNRAGLEFMQLSIDNVESDHVSKKSLRSLDQKLLELSQYAKFRVNINSVIGAGIEHPEDAITVAQRAMHLGFVSTFGIVHDRSGQSRPFSERERRVLRDLRQLSHHGVIRRFFNPLQWRAFNRFQDNLIEGRPNRWRCRAGARYLYICEHGKVHRCSQQQGFPGIPILDYTKELFDREFDTEKHCAPLCTIGCVQRTALLDNWRRPQSS